MSVSMPIQGSPGGWGWGIRFGPLVSSRHRSELSTGRPECRTQSCHHLAQCPWQITFPGLHVFPHFGGHHGGIVGIRKVSMKMDIRNAHLMGNTG